MRKQKYFESGMRYFNEQRYAEAAIEFQNAIQADKKFAQAHYKLAQCYLQRSLWSFAAQELIVTTQLDPANIPAQVDLANVIFAAKEFKEARARAAEILKQHPNQLQAQLLLANCDGELGNLRLAIDEANQAVTIAPHQAAPYVTLGLLREKARELPAAEQNLKKAVAAEPKSTSALLALGGFYQRQGRWPDAESQYRAAVEAGPSDPVPWSALASFYVARGDKDQAERVLTEARNAMPNNAVGYRLLGDFYATNGYTDRALAEFAALYQQHPKDLELKRHYIAVLVQGKRLDEATKLNAELLKENSADAVALLAKGRILLEQQKVHEALPVLQAAVRADPQSAEAHLELGAAYYQTNSVEDALKEWRKVVDQDSSNRLAWENMARLGSRQGDVHLIEECATALLKIAPDSPQGYTLRSNVLAIRGDLSGAEADVRKTIELDPHNAAAYTNLANLRFRQQRYAEAEKTYDQALSLNPGALDAMEGLTAVYLAEKQPRKAIARLQSSIAEKPANSSYYLLLADALLADHRTADAEQALQRAIELDKTNLPAFLLLARIQASSGRVDAAAAAYEQAIRDNPRNLIPYISLGMLEQSRGSWQKAADLYRKALQIQPDQPVAANNLSYLLLEHGGDVNFALSLAETARGGLTDSPQTADTLAWAYYKIGLYQSAVPLLEEASRKSPGNVTYLYHLGLAYQKLQKPELARASLERALQLGPPQARAGEIRNALQQLSQ